MELYKTNLITGKIDKYQVARETASFWIMANPDGTEGQKILKTSQEGLWYHASLGVCKMARLKMLRQVQAEAQSLQVRASAYIRQIIEEDAA